MIKFIKEDETLIAFNKQTGDTASIVKITEYGLLASKTAKYRVDYRGRTVDTMIVGLTRAKSIARNILRWGINFPQVFSIKQFTNK